MPIFKERDGKLKKLKTSDFDREKSLQSLVEENLYEVLDMHFLASDLVLLSSHTKMCFSLGLKHLTRHCT